MGRKFFKIAREMVITVQVYRLEFIDILLYKNVFIAHFTSEEKYRCKF